MKKIDSLAVLSGIILTLAGIALIVLGILFFLGLAIYGLVVLIVGVAILLTLEQQEKIEPIIKDKYSKR